MGDPISTIPTLPPRSPHATSSPVSSLAPVPVTVAAAVPVDAGAGVVPIVFAAAAAATHREAIREEARRKKAQVSFPGLF
ncbi:unnamed protein product [Urochloa humidicola]